MKVITSYNLIAIDRFMDRYGLSFINNFANGISKTCMSIYRRLCGEKALQDWRKESPCKHYWTYIDQKKKLTCGLGLIPLAGSVFIYFKNQREKVATAEARHKFDEALAKKLPTEEALNTLDTSARKNIWRDQTFIDRMLSEDANHIDQVPVEQQYEFGYLAKESDLVAFQEADDWLNANYPLSVSEGAMQHEREVEKNTSTDKDGFFTIPL